MAASRFLLKPILILTALFYINFLSRYVIAPLLPVIQTEYGLDYGMAGALFMFLAGGMAAGLLMSGYVASWLKLRRTIFVSALGMGIVLVVLSRSATPMVLYLCLPLLGASAGLYMPTAMSVLTELAAPRHWGKAIAIHELAPNVGLMTAPLLTELFLSGQPWRTMIGVLGLSQFVIAAVFLAFGQGGDRRGQRLNTRTLPLLFGRLSALALVATAVLAVGGADGIYAMLPLYLVREVGLARPWANTIVGLSHISGVVLVFFSGFIADRFGSRRTLGVFFAITGVSTVLLGSVTAVWAISLLAFVQATAVVCMFPPMLVVASHTFPQHLRNLGFSVMMALSVLVGAGLAPAVIGVLAERFSLAFGIRAFGIVILLALPLLAVLKTEPQGSSENDAARPRA